VRCLSNDPGASAEQIAAELLEDAASFAGGALRDDATMVVVRKLDDSGNGGGE
jgi:hypothetical protein